MEEKKINGEEPKLEEVLSPELMAQITGGDGSSGYTCNICGKTFMTITSIAAHMSSVHRNK